MPHISTAPESAQSLKQRHRTRSIFYSRDVLQCVLVVRSTYKTVLRLLPCTTTAGALLYQVLHCTEAYSYYCTLQVRRFEYETCFLSVSLGIDSLFKEKSEGIISRPSEHPPMTLLSIPHRGKNVKTLRWDHRLQTQNLFMAFKRVPRW